MTGRAAFAKRRDGRGHSDEQHHDATGMLIQNAHRQVRWSVKNPPSSGPITVVTPNTAPSAPW